MVRVTSSRPRGRRDPLWTAAACGVWAAVAALCAAQAPQPAVVQGQTERCRVEGRVKSGNIPLPGVSLVAQGETAKAGTSTDLDGKYTFALAPAGNYHLTAELTAFTRVERDVTLGTAPCDMTVDFEYVPSAQVAAE